jgi:hypothetical protein
LGLCWDLQGPAELLLLLLLLLHLLDWLLLLLPPYQLVDLLLLH